MILVQPDCWKRQAHADTPGRPLAVESGGQRDHDRSRKTLQAEVIPAFKSSPITRNPWLLR